MGLGFLNRRDVLKYASLSGIASLVTACLSQNAPPTSQATSTPAGQTPGTTGITQQPTVTFKAQTGFSARDFFHLVGVDWGKRVEEMSGGRIKVDTQPAGAIVGAFDILDAVHSGTLDVGHGVPAYWFGKNRAMSLFGTGPSFGMDAAMLISWIYYGGGQQLYDDLVQKTLRLNVQSFFWGAMPTQPLGWFRNEIKGPDDFKGMKFRTVGMAIDIYSSMGATVIAVPGGEVVPSLERGVIDAAEFNNPTSDKALGLQDVRKVCMTGSYHQATEFLEVLINKGKYDALPADLKSIVKNGTLASSADFDYRATHEHSRDFLDLQRTSNVRFVKTPKSVLDAQLAAWKTLIDKDSAANADFKKIYDSQKAWAQRVVPWRDIVDLPRTDQNAYQFFTR
ncbi:MAG TPA: TRAP transporter substrate-binding protein [Candidatus Limnocylindria bacterium]|nr:TRAP transporter substrate-binding protein [Candidatus Limnocylindria bacterium]